MTEPADKNGNLLQTARKRWAEGAQKRAAFMETLLAHSTDEGLPIPPTLDDEIPAPRVYTREEVRAKMIRYIWDMVDYWDTLQDAQGQRDRIAGLAFSMFVMLDGGCMDLPSFTVSPKPHPTDREDAQEHGENWFPEDGEDIGGELHSEFINSDPRKRP